MQKYEEEKFGEVDFYNEDDAQKCEICIKKLSHEDEQTQNVSILD